MAQLYPRMGIFYSKSSAQVLRDVVERVEPFYMAKSQGVEKFHLNAPRVQGYLKIINWSVYNSEDGT